MLFSKMCYWLKQELIIKLKKDNKMLVGLKEILKDAISKINLLGSNGKA